MKYIEIIVLGIILDEWRKAEMYFYHINELSYIVSGESKNVFFSPTSTANSVTYFTDIVAIFVFPFLTPVYQ